MSSAHPRLWWSTSPVSHPFWKHLCGRIHGTEPTSIGPERINKFHKAVLRPERSSLKTERAVKALFVYANLRFLNNVDNHIQCLWECLEQANDELTLAEALSIEHESLMAGLPTPTAPGLAEYDTALVSSVSSAVVSARVASK